MQKVRSSPKAPLTIYGSTALSFASHLFGVLTCATCWALFAPALGALFGSAGTAFMASLRPLAPTALAISAVSLAYSFYRLTRVEGASRNLTFKIAATFTTVSAISWLGAAVYTAVTLIQG